MNSNKDDTNETENNEENKIYDITHYYDRTSCLAPMQNQNQRPSKIVIASDDKLKTLIAYNLNKETLEQQEEFKVEDEMPQIEKLGPILELNEELTESFQTLKPIISSFNAENAEKNEVSKFFSRYNTLDKSSSLLSFKRRREQLIKESYESFGFSFDSGVNLKKGLSRVEREKINEKNKRDIQILTNIDINLESRIPKTDSNDGNKSSEIKETVNKRALNSSNNFMQDALVKKTRVERDKGLFLEQQMNSKIEANSNNNYLNYKQRKQALVNSLNSGN